MGYPRGADTSFNPIYEGGGETKIFHDLEQKIMFDSIKHICQVEFDYHTFVFSVGAWVQSLLH